MFSGESISCEWAPSPAIFVQLALSTAGWETLAVLFPSGRGRGGAGALAWRGQYRQHSQWPPRPRSPRPIRSTSAHVSTALSLSSQGCPWWCLWGQGFEGESRRQTPQFFFFLG